MNQAKPPFVDEFLPTFDVESQHSTTVQASSEVVYDAARTLDLSSSWIARSLFRVRGMPAASLNLKGLERLHFKPLLELPPQGFVLGIVGQFWSPSGRLLDFDPAHFTDMDPEGHAKAIWTFDVSKVSTSHVRLRTVTRVACPDRATRRRFLLYWKVVGPFSGVIRRVALASVRRVAEARSIPGST